MKTCRQVFREYQDEHHRIFNKMDSEMRTAKAAQFPVGTRVVWSRGRNKVHGVVTETPDYISDAVMVRRDGAKHDMQKKAYELEVEVKNT